MAELSGKGSHAELYKNTNRGDAQALHRKRNEESFFLRKQKRDEQVSKRRPVVIDFDSGEETSPHKENVPPDTPLMALAECVKLIKSHKRDDQLHGTQGVRRRLSKERFPPIKEVLKAGIMRHFVDFLTASDMPLLQFESAWALTNIASGDSEETAAVVEAGAVPHFVTLLSSSEPQVVEQAVWALGNIAGDGSAQRDIVIDAGATDLLIQLATDTPQDKVVHLKDLVAFLRNVAWTLSNLCRHKNPHPPVEVVQPIIHCLGRLVTYSDREIVTDSLWALSYCADGDNAHIDCVVDAGVIPRVVSLLSTDESKFTTPSLRTLGNIVTGSDSQTQAVIDAGLLPLIPNLITKSRASTQKECAWLISNITAGNAAQIQACIDADVVLAASRLFEIGDHRAQREAVWVITNMTSGGTLEQIGYLIKIGGLRYLAKTLTGRNLDANISVVIIDAIANICRAATRVGQMRELRQLLEETNVIDALEEIQQTDIYANQQVANGLDNLIDEFLSDADAEEQLVPTENKDQFEFNDPTSHCSDVTDVAREFEF